MFLLCLLPQLAMAFLSSSIASLSRSDTRSFQRSSRLYAQNSYEAMLARAKAEKMKKQPQPVSAAKSVPPVAPKAVAPPVQASAPSMTQPKKSTVSVASNGLPFSDKMYDELKYVIAKLTLRMKSDTPLPAEDIKKFRASVNAIIADLGIDAPPASVAAPVASAAAPRQPASKSPAFNPMRATSETVAPPKRSTSAPEASIDPMFMPGSGPKSTEAPDPNSAFSPLHGLSNTWQIEGMDQMSTEEYYQKINERNTQMKQMRKAKGEPYGSAATEDYFAFLEKKKRDAQTQQE